MKNIQEYENYDDIPEEEFSEVIEQLAFENMADTISLPGIYEIISEHYNNEALDLLCPDLAAPGTFVTTEGDESE
jgi:hypothetical protein